MLQEGWEQLVTRLTERDYPQQYGNEDVDFETKAPGNK